jgi:hypothetical protein
LLKNLAQFESDESVRSWALEQLALRWSQTSGMFEFLYRCAVTQSFERQYDFEDNPRLKALVGIVQHYPHHPETQPLLQDRLAHDPDDKVREFASEQLKQFTIEN